MLVLKKLGTVAAGTMVVIGGMAAAAAPASANTCAGPVYNPLDPTTFVNVCADAGTYDADPGSAGFGVHAAASASISLGGYSHFCTGYYGAGANLNFSTPLIVDPDTQTGDPGACD